MNTREIGRRLSALEAKAATPQTDRDAFMATAHRVAAARGVPVELLVPDVDGLLKRCAQAGPVTESALNNFREAMRR